MKTKDINNTEEVDAYLEKLVHPLKVEIEAVRGIIKNVSPKVSERIKWNAPSFFYKEDFATFNHRAEKFVHLVFHHKFIVDIASDLLEGDYKDRRMTYFKNREEVESKKSELERVIHELILKMDVI